MSGTFVDAIPMWESTTAYVRGSLVKMNISAKFRRPRLARLLRVSEVTALQAPLRARLAGFEPAKSGIYIADKGPVRAPEFSPVTVRDTVFWRDL